MTTPATCVICGMPFDARSSYGLCPLCWESSRLRQWDRLQSATHQAKRAGLPATLTLPQLLATISDFNGLCAYCQEVSFSFIDMVDPSRGLTYENAVPICRACQKHKRLSFERARERVRAYLAGERVPVATYSEVSHD